MEEKSQAIVLFVNMVVFSVDIMVFLEGHWKTVYMLCLKACTPHRAPTPVLTPKTQHQIAAGDHKAHQLGHHLSDHKVGVCELLTPKASPCTVAS